jgi:hypothetical protein
MYGSWRGETVEDCRDQLWVGIWDMANRENRMDLILRGLCEVYCLFEEKALAYLHPRTNTCPRFRYLNVSRVTLEDRYTDEGFESRNLFAQRGL